MNNLIIELSQSSVENVTSDIIEKLYTLAKTSNVENENNNFLMSLKGSLHSNAAYEESVLYLRLKFPQLIITILDNRFYIKFADDKIEELLLTNNIGDGYGVTLQDASTANLGTVFENNTEITEFNEFKYFTRANTNPPSRLFKNCTALTQIDMSNISLISLEEFKYTAIKEVNAPNLLLFIGQALFLDCGSLESVISLGNITSIPQNCFRNCDNLESVYLPSSCTTIANSETFMSCSSLSSINLSNLTNIGNNAFADCSSLVINTSELLNCTSLGSYVFRNTLRINGDVFLPNLISAGNGPFRETNGIQKVTSLGKLSTISSDFFYNPKDVNSLKEVYIPYECTEIGANVFRNNKSLTTIKQYTESVNNWINGLPSVYGGCTRVTKLNNNCFDTCESLTNLELGNVTSIPDYAFSNCKSIQHLNIQFENLAGINTGAFSGCISLNWGVLRYTGSYFLQGTDHNGDPVDASSRMFSGNTFKQLYLPNLKTSGKNGLYRNYITGNSYFGSNYGILNSSYGLLYLKNIDSLFPGTFAGTDITSLVFNNSIPPICYNLNKLPTVTNNDDSKDNVFKNMSNATKIYVPDASINDYKTADVWSTVASQIYPMSELTTYATEADWRAAGEPNTGLIEEYM